MSNPARSPLLYDTRDTHRHDSGTLTLFDAELIPRGAERCRGKRSRRNQSGRRIPRLHSVYPDAIHNRLSGELVVSEKPTVFIDEGFFFVFFSCKNAWD